MNRLFCRCIHSSPVQLLPGCKSEQAAAKLLGFIQTTWDNLSGKQKQPSSADKYWAQLTSAEKAAAGLLGYIAKVWDNASGKEKQPASASKYWAKLSACGDNCCCCSPFLISYSVFVTDVIWSHDRKAWPWR